MSNRTRVRRPVILIILDGWGYRESSVGNAVALARTPTWERLWAAHPRTFIRTSGLAVGLPEGQMGNSEVGHLNLGAGRVVPQDIVRISQAIESGAFYTAGSLQRLCASLHERNGTLHLLSLIGPGGVHALDEHLAAAIELGSRAGLRRVAIHAFLDGRDTPPKSARASMESLLGHVAAARVPTHVATVIGRYYAMDRDRRWDRTRTAYDALVKGSGLQITDPVAGIRGAYSRGESDEFVKPLVVEGAPRISDGDGVFCINFRADRMRQIVRALAAQDFDGFDVATRPDVNIVTMTSYDESLPLPHVFAPISLQQILAEVLSDGGLRQLRTAETEKYPHVTYFFNGGREKPFPGEDRALVPSPRVATYDLQPEMSALQVTDTLCAAIEAGKHDFILCNFANGDMVGHTGVLEAAIRAVECVDGCMARVLERAEVAGATTIITADHGNCEQMIDPDTGGPHTAHTTTPVPLIVVGMQGTSRLRQGGALCDVAPTVLGLLDLPLPAEMTGQDLRVGD